MFHHFFYALIAHFFLVRNNVSLSGGITVYLSIRLLKKVLAIMNKAAVNICVQVFCEHKFSTYLGKYQGTRLLDCMFSFVRKRPTVLQGGCIIMQSQQH